MLLRPFWPRRPPVIVHRRTPASRGQCSADVPPCVTVFGCTGFTGTQVAARLGALGYRLILPYRGGEYNASHLKVIIYDVGQTYQCRWDLRDEESIYRALSVSDAVINVVGANVATRNFSLADVNVDGARRIAKVAFAAGTSRLIHFSIAGFDPSAPSEFVRTKSLGEIAVREAFPAATIVRPTDMYGHDDKLLMRLGEQIRYWPVFPRLAPGRRIQPVHVLDVANAVAAILRSRKTAGKVFQLGGPTVWTQGELYDFVFERLRRWPIVLDNPEWWLRPLVRYVMHYHRRPRYTLDTFREHALDRVVVADPDARTFEHLGMPPERLMRLEAACPGILRIFERTEELSIESKTWHADGRS